MGTSRGARSYVGSPRSFRGDLGSGISLIAWPMRNATRRVATVKDKKETRRSLLRVIPSPASVCFFTKEANVMAKAANKAAPMKRIADLVVWAEDMVATGSSMTLADY